MSDLALSIPEARAARPRSATRILRTVQTVSIFIIALVIVSPLLLPR